MSVTVRSNLITWDTADATSGWTSDGGGVNDYSGFQIEGSACLGEQADNGAVNVYFTGSSTNLSAHIIYVWLRNGNPATIATGGYRIVLGDGTNTIAYHVGGSDALGFSQKGWNCFILDTTNLPSQFTTLSGSEVNLNTAAITQIGGGWYYNSKSVGNSDNVFIDAVRYCPIDEPTLVIRAGDSSNPGTFDEIVIAGDTTDTAWGVIEELQSGIIGVQGALRFGDTGTGSSYFKDVDKVIVFENPSVTIGDTYYVFNTLGNSTGTNTFLLGNKVGSGDDAIGSNGVTIQSAGPALEIDFSGANMENINIYGSKFFKCSKGIILSGDTDHEFAGNTIDQCGQADASNMTIRNCTFSGTTDTNYNGTSLLWNTNINIKNCSFNANSVPSATGDTTTAGIEHTNSGDTAEDYDNLKFSGNDVDVEWSNGSAGDTLTINSLNGSNPTTGEITGSGDTINFVNAVNLTVTVINEAGATIQNAQTAIFRRSDSLVLMNEDTNASGVAVESYNYLGDTGIILRVRKSSLGGTRYFSNQSTGTIGLNGFSSTITLIQDKIASN